MTHMGGSIESLADETKHVLATHGYSGEDVLWVGIPAKEDWTYEDFVSVAERIYYDNGFGAQEVEPSLVVCMRDGSWFERAEYDGSEWWEHKASPQRSAQRKRARKDRILVDTY